MLKVKTAQLHIEALITIQPNNYLLVVKVDSNHDWINL